MYGQYGGDDQSRKRPANSAQPGDDKPFKKRWRGMVLYSILKSWSSYHTIAKISIQQMTAQLFTGFWSRQNGLVPLSGKAVLW